MRRILLLGAAFLGFAGSASAQTLDVVNDADVPQATIDSMELAAADELNNDVTRYYPDATPITGWNDPNGWQIVLVPRNGPSWPHLCAAFVGCHSSTGSSPIAYVQWDSRSFAFGEYVFSHETLEMMTDPYGEGPEIADPVEWQTGTLDGVTVAAFQEPGGSAWTPPQPPMPSSMRPDPAPLSERERRNPKLSVLCRHTPGRHFELNAHRICSRRREKIARSGNRPR